MKPVATCTFLLLISLRVLVAAAEQNPQNSQEPQEPLEEPLGEQQDPQEPEGLNDSQRRLRAAILKMANAYKEHAAAEQNPQDSQEPQEPHETHNPLDEPQEPHETHNPLDEPQEAEEPEGLNDMQRTLRAAILRMANAYKEHAAQGSPGGECEFDPDFFQAYVDAQRLRNSCLAPASFREVMGLSEY